MARAGQVVGGYAAHENFVPSFVGKPQGAATASHADGGGWESLWNHMDGSIMENPKWVSNLNSLAASCGGSEYVLGLDADELIAVARASTGLNDFGGGDWAKNFYNMTSSYKSANLTLLGRLRARSSAIRNLRNRLGMIDRIKKNPMILDEIIESPLFIIGNPRSGTSLLYELMAVDKSLRAPLAWEANCPVDFGGAIDASEVSRGANDLLHDIRPDLDTIHEFKWDHPVECFQIMEMNFFTVSYATDCPSQWLEKMSPVGSYRWHKLFLQFLQHGSASSSRWLLKCPYHLHFVEQLRMVYPDARIIWIHRDPAKSLPSFRSLSRNLSDSVCSVPSSEPYDSFGVRLESIRKMIRDRSVGKLSDKFIVDVQYLDLVVDPVRTIKKIYLHFDMPFRVEMAESISTYMKNSKFSGAHVYNAEKLGLSLPVIREMFGFYTDHYQIPLEV